MRPVKETCVVARVDRHARTPWCVQYEKRHVQMERDLYICIETYIYAYESVKRACSMRRDIYK